jgi:hypothetical protein
MKPLFRIFRFLKFSQAATLSFINSLSLGLFTTPFQIIFKTQVFLQPFSNGKSLLKIALLGGSFAPDFRLNLATDVCPCFNIRFLPTFACFRACFLTPALTG